MTRMSLVVKRSANAEYVKLGGSGDVRHWLQQDGLLPGGFPPSGPLLALIQRFCGQPYDLHNPREDAGHCSVPPEAITEEPGYERKKAYEWSHLRSLMPTTPVREDDH